MRHIHGRLAMAGLLFVWATLALAGDGDPSYQMKQDKPAVGTMLKRGVVTGPLPYDKRYDQLTPAQRQQVKSHYDSMADDDEPPFPAEGLGPMMRALHKGADTFEPTGLLDAEVEVGPDGTARSIKIYKATDVQRFTQYAAQVLMLTHYKPAVCGGKPCVMWYPVSIEFTVDNSL